MYEKRKGVEIQYRTMVHSVRGVGGGYGLVAEKIPHDRRSRLVADIFVRLLLV